MSDPKGFLARWSRRKREAEDTTHEAAEGDSSAHSRASGNPALDPSPGLTRGSRGDERDVSAGSGAAPVESPKEPDKPSEPAFDLSKLPSIESITAETDIRVFLAPGVPPALMRAALRRAWVIDPKIRDFIEVAENQWDFTAPGVPGFDLSLPTGDIKQMLAQVFGNSAIGEARKAKEDERSEAPQTAAEAEPHRNVNEPAQSEETPAQSVAQSETENSVRRVIVADSDSADAAPQNRDTPQDERPTPKRGHGGAMPR
jgi:hypothetical protein